MNLTRLVGNVEIHANRDGNWSITENGIQVYSGPEHRAILAYHELLLSAKAKRESEIQKAAHPLTPSVRN